MIKYLVIGPGSIGIFAMLGCMQMLKDTNKLDIKEISGTSSGSMLGFLYILFQGDLKKILSELIDADIESNTKVNIRTLFKKYGFIDTCGIKTKLEEISYRVCKIRNPTFKELYEKFPIKLHISAYCLESGKTEYFSYDTHPNMKVLEVICASIAVPFLFSAHQLNGKTYVDGGISESIPLVPFLSKSSNDVFCIKIITKDTKIENISDIKLFTQQLVRTLLKNRINYDINKTLCIDLSDFDIFDFKMSDKQKIELFVKGYLAH